MVLIGNRGMGKTVTLGMIREQAERSGFVTAATGFDASSNNAQRLAAAIAEAVEPLHRAGAAWDRLRQRLGQLQIEVNAGVVKMSGRLANAQDTDGAGQRDVLRRVLVDGARIAAERHRAGLALHIDELQEAGIPDLAVVANALQDSLHEQVPLVAFGAGLPTTPGRIMEAASFTERFDFRPLGPLSDQDATVALLEPALGVGVTWEDHSAQLIIDAAKGSPYLLQRMGDEVWQIANPTAAQRSITVEHARKGLAEVAESLATGMFPGRYQRASNREKRLMAAIAQVVNDRGTARVRDVALVMGEDQKQFSVPRQHLIDKGLIESRGRGELGFTMAGFDAYVRHQADVPLLDSTHLERLHRARKRSGPQNPIENSARTAKKPAPEIER